MSTAFDEMVRPPKRVVAVASAHKYASYSYVMATVYDLTPRKDGTLIYRRSHEQYAEPHRSQPLALKDAEQIAEQLEIPLWKHVRHNMEASLAVELAEVFTRKYDVLTTTVSPTESHCARCLKPAPPGGGQGPEALEWEALVVDASSGIPLLAPLAHADHKVIGVICPDCITPEEQQEMDDALDAVMMHDAHIHGSPYPLQVGVRITDP
jgi:hypothetical protein